MVVGLEFFKEHFKGYEDHYVLIGGAACDLAMDAIGESFRTTKDLDIVICIESLTPDFISLFWDFVKAGNYEIRQKSTDKKLFYRFHSPAIKEYPFMLELFSRIPDALNFKGEGHLTPIPTEDEASSLSAILLNGDYYTFLQAGKTKTYGVPVVKPEYIIPLKAKAWLDLTQRKTAGEKIDTKTINKHRADIFRLYRILVPDDIPKIEGQIADDLRQFADTVITRSELPLNSYGYKRSTKSSTIITEIRQIYGINN